MRGRVRDETGMALPVAMAVLALTLIIAGWVASTALDLHASSEDDRGSKRALGPADAGLAHARWRLNETSDPVAANECLLSGTRQAVAAGAPCPAAPSVSMGNGATYSYVVTPEYTSAGTCAGIPTAPGDRCVTAVGTVAGVSRRVQAKLARQIVSSTWTHVGLIGKTSVTLGNGVEA